jgi:hypothetical protein
MCRDSAISTGTIRYEDVSFSSDERQLWTEKHIEIPLRGYFSIPLKFWLPLPLDESDEMLTCGGLAKM